MLLLLPTDTCYGLAGELNEQDYNEIYRLKGRDFVKPLAWLIEDYVDLQKYIEITDEQIEILKQYNRPWSILGKRRTDYILPDFLDKKIYEKISLRVASACLCHREVVEDFAKRESDPVFQELGSPRHLPQKQEDSSQGRIHNIHLSFPLFLTSANLSGNPESTTFAEAIEYFPGIDGYDGGVCDLPPSDIFSFGVDNELIYFRKSSI